MVNDTLLDPDLTRALCILHYQTPGSLKLHYLHPSSPQRKRKRRVRGEEKGQLRSYPKPCAEGAFSSRSGRYSAVSLPSHSLSFSLSFPRLSSPCFLRWEPVKYNNTRVHPGTPKKILPGGIFGEILETHQRGHPTLYSSHTDGTNGMG